MEKLQWAGAKASAAYELLLHAAQPVLRFGSEDQAGIPCEQGCSVFFN